MLTPIFIFWRKLFFFGAWTPFRDTRTVKPGSLPALPTTPPPRGLCPRAPSTYSLGPSCCRQRIASCSCAIASRSCRLIASASCVRSARTTRCRHAPGPPEPPPGGAALRSGSSSTRAPLSTRRSLCLASASARLLSTAEEEAGGDGSSLEAAERSSETGRRGEGEGGGRGEEGRAYMSYRGGGG